MNENLRQQTKILKALQGISYAELADAPDLGSARHAGVLRTA